MRVVVDLDGGLDQLLAIFFGLVLEIVGDFDDVPVSAERSSRQTSAFISIRSTTPLKSFSAPIGKLHDDGLRAKARLDHLDRAVEVGADLVHLVDEADARHVVLVGLTPDGFGLRLNTGIGIENATAPSSTRSERSTSMVKSTWPGVSMMLKRRILPSSALPERGRRSRRDRDAALLLLLHPVHGGGALMDLADLVRLAGVKEDALGRRRLAGVDVRHDAEIAVVFDRVFAGHGECQKLRKGAPLPAVVREGAVGLGHPVGVFALLDGGPTVVRGVEQLGREALDHGRFVALARSDQPADGQRLTALGTNIDRNLIGRTTDTARTDFDMRRNIFERLMEHGHRLLLGLAFNLRRSAP